MIKRIVYAAVSAAFAATMSVTSASASTITTTFDLIWKPGTSYGNQWTHSYTEGDLSLGVFGFVHDEGDFEYQTTVGKWGTGLGISSGKFDDHKVDGKGPDEMVLFVFSEEVTLESVKISYFDKQDDLAIATYDLVFGNGTAVLDLGDFETDVDPKKLNCWGGCNGGWADNGVTKTKGFPDLTSQIFGIGADDKKDEFKIHSITVTHMAPVPLPAAGFMLLAGLGGLAVMRRRQTKTAA
ncbi:MAG: VPLPA-CTERM sorting domain-containing protein [Rhodobacteraceae bacterium]|nr:VPLPA-CTERM sorting domain-containing protein [Paracoccaceae bacterium]